MVGMDGIHSGWLGEAALRGLGRRSRWQRGRCACQGPWVIQILLGLSTAQVWGLPRLVLLGMSKERRKCHSVSNTQDNHLLLLILQPSSFSQTPKTPHGRHLDRTGGRMLGLRLAPSRCGGRLRLVGMERCGMMWIGLVNSGCSRKEENQCSTHKGG